MEFKLLILFSLLSLSLAVTENRYKEINYETTNSNPFPYFSLEIGSKKSLLQNFIISIYYPCLVYFQDPSVYDETKSETYTEITDQVSLVENPEYSSEKSDFKVGEENLYFNGEESNGFELEKVKFLMNEKNETEGPKGYMGLGFEVDPDASEGLIKDGKDQYGVNVLNMLYESKQINNKMFSLGPMKKKSDGSFKGTVYLGGKHSDFMTLKEGETFSCSNNNKYYWGCDIKRLILPSINNNKNNILNLNEKIIFYNHDFSAIFPKKYLNTFLEKFPEENKCKIDEENNDSIICESWSTNGIKADLSFEGKKNDEAVTYDFTINIDDLNDLYGKERKHFIFSPNIRFSDTVKDIYIPMIWFRDYHVLFDKEKKTISFHAYDKETIKIEGEEGKVDESSYLKIHKATFVILCIFLGVVIVALILFLGYLKIQNKNTGKGATRADVVKKINSGDILYKRQTSYDSSLLGKSSDAMPRRVKTLKVKSNINV